MKYKSTATIAKMKKTIRGIPGQAPPKITNGYCTSSDLTHIWCMSCARLPYTLRKI